MSKFCVFVSYVFLVIYFVLIAPSDGTIPLDLREELERESLILNLRDRLQLSMQGYPDVKFQVVDQFLNLGGNPRPSGVSWIKVDPLTGEVTQEKRIDREELCGAAADCYIVVTMVIHPQSSLRTESLHFYITDINDHKPTFAVPVIDLSVPETSPIGFGINLDKTQATDPDKGENSTITYSLTPPSDYFAVHQSVDENGYHHLRLEVIKELDYETSKIHRVTLKANDGGSPSLSSTVNVRITVEDENDNSPVFDEKQYLVNLREDSPLEADITVVHATDGDAGIRGRIRYLIRDNSAQPNSNGDPEAIPITSRRYPVTVNAITGAVVLRDKLNHKIHNGLKIFIEAVDGDEDDPKIGRTLLILRVDDINDNPPLITVNFITYSQGHRGYVSEDASIGTYLAHVSATDADEGLNGDVTISAETVFTNGNRNFTEMGKFLVTDENLLVTGIEFDRESLNRYDVIITATDKGLPPKSSTAAITIIILDVNEYAPKFHHSDIVVNLPEDQEVGSMVAIASASDLDDGNGPSWRMDENEEIEPSLNGVVTYGLTLAEINDERDEAKPVRIAPDTGKITLIRSLDYETKKTWQLVITARDGGRPMALQSTCKLTIKVDNVNDNEPTFVQPEKDNSTVYASTLGSSQVFYTIKALDFGVDEQTNLKYSFRVLEKDGNPAFNPIFKKLFHLGRKSGDFSFDSTDVYGNDFLGIYKTKIRVSDSGNPPRVTSLNLYVNVIDTPLPEDPNRYTGDGRKGDVEPSMMVILIGAGVGGALLLLLLIIVVIVIILRGRKKKRRKNEPDEACQSLSPSTPSDVQPSLTVRTLNGAQDSLRRSVKDDNAFNTSSTRRTSVNASQEKSCNYCEAPNSPRELKKFIEVQHTDHCSPVSSPPRWPPVSPTANHIPSRGYGDLRPMHEYGVESDDVSEATGMGEQCTYLCKLHGHSDTCWMPTKDQSVNPEVRLPWHQKKAGSYRKDSGCSVDTSSSNLSYCKLTRGEKRQHRDDVFLMNDASLPDVIGKARTLTYSDGGSMMSSNASSGTSRQSKTTDVLQSPKMTKNRSSRNSRGDSTSRNNFISSQSTRC